MLSQTLRSLPFPAALAVAFLLLPLAARAQSLHGSATSLAVQIEQARAHDFTYLETPRQLRRFVGAGYLVPVRPNANLALHAVSYPYARPQVRLFVQRLARQHRRACGRRLVVTSLTRPLSVQPWNSSPQSVHPTGMAVDIRRSSSRACRSWLERVLLGLEANRLIEATRESFPPHYHVAVFPQPYARYVARLRSRPTARRSPTASGPAISLWDVAQAHDTSAPRAEGGEPTWGRTGSYPGQVLAIPGRELSEACCTL